MDERGKPSGTGTYSQIGLPTRRTVTDLDSLLSVLVPWRRSFCVRKRQIWELDKLFQNYAWC